MAYIQSENKLKTCPYDESHRMKASRYQLHIAKCKLNHLDVTKKICPFNATHLLECGEYDHHITHCSDRSPLDRQLAQTVDQNNPYKGRTAVPKFSDPYVETDENWDMDISQPMTLPARPPPGAIFEPPQFSKPAERKTMYRNLHRVQTETEDKKSSPDKRPVPRQPNFSEITRIKQNEPDARSIQNLGLGRGKPSRIAANFNNINGGASEKASYSNIVKDLSNLGLGRGQPPANQAAGCIYDDDDFPTLGCGKGVLQVKKQSVRTPVSKTGK